MKLNKKSLKKPLIILLVIAVLYTYALPWAITQQFAHTKTDITIAFEGVGKGLDPQGNRFDINEMKSDKILKKAIEKSGLAEKVSAAELQRKLFILPMAEHDTLRELLTLTTINGKSQEIKERMVYPTSFTIGLIDTGFPSYFSDKKLLQTILSLYKEQLKSKYLADILSEPAYTTDEILKMDYPEMMKVLEQEAESLLLYIDSYADNEPQFRSQETGLTFKDVKQQATLLKDTDISMMRSLVDFYELTEDAQSRILYEETMLKRAGVVASKLQGAELTTADILQIYDNNSNYIFASGDTGSVNLTPLENQFYGDLIQALVNKQTSYINAKYNQQDIQRAIAKLQAGTITGAAYVTLTDEIKSGTRKALDRIEVLRKQTQGMAGEFYDSSIGNKIGMSGTSYDVKSNGNILINFVALTGIYILLNMFYNDVKKSSYNRYLKIIVEPFRRKKHGN